MKPSTNKQQLFREQIRKRNLSSHFQEIRALIHHRQTNNTQLTSLDPQLQIIINRSLQKNSLLSQVLNENLLERLIHKVEVNPSISNLEFFLSVASNILLDDIELIHKEKIFFCVKYLSQIKVFPAIQSYFYKNLILSAYDCLGEDDQILLEKAVLPKLIQLIYAFQSISTLSSWEQSARQSHIDNIIRAFYYFLSPDLDHNNFLIYKIQRNKRLIAQFIVLILSLKIQWVDLQIMASILKNISEVGMLTDVMSEQELVKTIQMVLNIFITICKGKDIDKETKKSDCVLILRILMTGIEDSQGYIFENVFPSETIKIMTESTLIEESHPLLIEYFAIWEKILLIKQQQQEDIVCEIICKGLEILKEENINNQTLSAVLKFFNGFFATEFKKGRIEYLIFFRNSSGLDIIESNFINRNTPEELCQVIEEIQGYINLV